MKLLLKNRKLWLVAAAAVIGWWWWQSAGDGGMDNRAAVAVQVAPVEQRDMPIALKNVGTVVTYDSVAVRARLDSQVMEVAFKDGDYVEKGDLLFVLDDRALKARLGEMEANLKRDQAQLTNLRQQYERVRQLADKEYETQANLDAAKAAYEAQAATFGATEAAIENIRVQLEYTRITAPISGRTGTINITVGNTVKANDTQALVVINQVKPIRVQVSLPQRYLNHVRESMAQGQVTVTALREGSAAPSYGTLEYIDNAVDQSTGTFAARASFPNEDEALWPGMYVNLILVLGEEKNALVVPEVAIQHGQEGSFVFVVNDDKAVKRPVGIARLQDSTAVIESGVVAGERVVVDGLMSLVDGSPVTVQAGGAAAPESP